MIGTIYIAYESETVGYARVLADCWRDQPVQVVLRERGTFPMGDAIVRFFMNLESLCDVGFVVVSESSTSRAWAAGELAQQKIMGNCQRIYPAFLPGVSVPDWWQEDDQSYLTINANICQKVNVLSNHIFRE